MTEETYERAVSIANQIAYYEQLQEITGSPTIGITGEDGEVAVHDEALIEIINEYAKERIAAFQAEFDAL